MQSAKKLKHEFQKIYAILIKKALPSNTCLITDMEDTQHSGHIGEMLLEGIPRDAILVVFRLTSTYEDAMYSREWALKLGIRSLIAIEDPFGMRRLRWTFRKVFTGSGIQLNCLAVPPEMSTLNPERWWTREKELLYVFEEYIKLMMYWVKY